MSLVISEPAASVCGNVRSFPRWLIVIEIMTCCHFLDDLLSMYWWTAVTVVVTSCHFFAVTRCQCRSDEFVTVVVTRMATYCHDLETGC